MTYPPQQPLSQDPRYAYAPAYGQPPAMAAQPPHLGGQQPPTAAPKLGESGKGGGGGATAPAPRHLVGRTVILEPIRIDETTTQRDNAGNMVVRPTAYYNLTVVDGGPLQYGDNRDHDISKQHGMTFEVQTPARFLNVASDRFGIVNEVRDTMARGEMASVGVIVQGTKGNRPFLMTKCSRDLDGNERPDGAQRFEAATQVWNQIFAKTLVSPEPRSLVAPPAQQPPQVAYQPTAPAGYVQQPYPYGGAAQPLAQQSPYMPQGYATQNDGNGVPQGYIVGQQQAQPGYPQGYGQYAAPQPEMAPAAMRPPAQPQAPVNQAFEAWLATLPPEQQAAQRATLAGQAPAAAQPQQPGGPGF